ncbi:retrovirus-related pol polyprotein from transposon TNT 1-94 [Tanacetum coccineum]
MWYLDSGCSKHMIENRSQLTNFVNKFFGNVKFGNDQIAKIIGYGDYQIGNVTISRVYYIEGLRHNLFSVGQFYDSDLEVAFRKHTCFVHNLEGVVLLMGSRGTNLYTLSIARTPQQNGVVERQNRTIVKVARTMLIYDNAPLFMWAEVVAAACYTQNRSLIRLRHEKTPYELVHDRKPDISYLHVFGALCYPTNDIDDLGKLKAKADVGIFIGYAPTKKAYRIYNQCTRRNIETIHVDFDELITMASEQSSSGPALHEMTPRTLSSGLVRQPHSSTPFVPPTRNNWDTLLQPLFDEYFRPLPCVDHPVPKVATPVPVVSTNTSSLILVDQDAPSPSTLQTPQESPSHVIPPELSSKESSSQVVIPNNVHSVNQPPEHISKWTKDHPIDNVIGDPSRPVSTRHQLQTEALLCYFDAFLSSVEPKSYKEALTESYWIEAMQEELNEFERLEV